MLLHGLALWMLLPSKRPTALPPQQIVQISLFKKIAEPERAPAPLPRLVSPAPIIAIAPAFAVSSPPRQAVRALPRALPASAATSAASQNPDVAPKIPPDYLSRLIAHLNMYKNYPYEARMHHQEGVVTLRFKLDRSGRLQSYEIAHGSGWAGLDQAALDTIRRADPFPAPPQNYKGGQIDLVVPLVFSLH